jgi:predicted transcriptional regulator YdeE
MDKPQIVEIGPLLLAGVSFFGDPFTYHSEWENKNEIGQLWTRFYQLLENEADFREQVLSAGIQYEMHLMHPQSRETGAYEVFIGIPIKDPANVPVHFLIKHAPAKRYLQYRIKGQDIMDDIQSMPIAKDAQALGVDTAPDYHLVGYNKDFLGMERLDESTVLIFIPLLAS